MFIILCILYTLGTYAFIKVLHDESLKLNEIINHHYTMLIYFSFLVSKVKIRTSILLGKK